MSRSEGKASEQGPCSQRKDFYIRLKEAGIREIFAPGTPLGEVVKWVEENVKPRGSSNG
jgi:methylmalonyl-CoA mutase cobalamin-binding subunit